MKSKFFQNYMKQFDDMPKAFRKSKYIFVYLMVSLAIVNFIVFYVVNWVVILEMVFKHFLRMNPPSKEVTLKLVIDLAKCSMNQIQMFLSSNVSIIRKRYLKNLRLLMAMT